MLSSYESFGWINTVSIGSRALRHRMYHDNDQRTLLPEVTCHKSRCRLVETWMTLLLHGH